MKKRALFLLVIINILLRSYSIYAEAKTNHAIIELRCINISAPNKPISVGDVFEIQIIGNKIENLYGYSINLLYDPDIITVIDSVYESVYQEVYDKDFDLNFDNLNVGVYEEVYKHYTVTKDVYSEIVSENIYAPYIHSSIFDGLETFSINTIYKDHIGSKSNGISLNGLNNAVFIELLKGKKEGIDISDDIIASIRFKALKEAVIPLLPSNKLTDISDGANLIIQMANSSIGNDNKMSYDIILPYGELIIGDGTHTLPKTYSFIYHNKKVQNDNNRGKRSKITVDQYVEKKHNKSTFDFYTTLWEISGNFSKPIELGKTLLIVKKQRESLPKIEYRLDEEEIMSIIEKTKDNIILSIPINKEYESNDISVSLSLNTLKKIKESSRGIMLRCNTSICSSQINLSSIDFNLPVNKLGQNINIQFVYFVLEMSKVSNEKVVNNKEINISTINNGIYINTYIKYGRKKQPLLNQRDWFECIIPYRLKVQDENSHISCLLIQNGNITVIPVKFFEQDGVNFVKIKTLCSNGIFYPALSKSLKEPAIEIDKHTPLPMKQLMQRRIFKGYTDGKLYGYEPLTRSQYVVLLTRLFGMKIEDRIKSNFKDIKDETWYSTEVEQLY